MRSLSRRLAKNGRNADRLDRRPHRRRRSQSIKRTLVSHEADIHLRAWAGRARADRFSAETFSRSRERALTAETVRRRRLFHWRQTVSAKAAPGVQLTIDGQSVTVPAGTTIF